MKLRDFLYTLDAETVFIDGRRGTFEFFLVGGIPLLHTGELSTKYVISFESSLQIKIALVRNEVEVAIFDCTNGNYKRILQFYIKKIRSSNAIEFAHEIFRNIKLRATIDGISVPQLFDVIKFVEDNVRSSGGAK